MKDNLTKESIFTGRSRTILHDAAAALALMTRPVITSTFSLRGTTGASVLGIASSKDADL